MSTLELITQATTKPLSVLEARQHCRASEDDDVVLALYLAAATQAVQDETGRSLITETWRYSMAGFTCGEIILPRAPLVAVTSVDIWDADGADVAVAGAVYQVTAPAGPTAQPGRVALAPSQAWPDVQSNRADAVRVTFTAGYGTDGEAVPPTLRAAILLMTGSMYEFREADAVKALSSNPAVARLLSPYRLIWI